MSRPQTLPSTPEVEHRRATFRESKRRAADRKANRKANRKAAIADLLDRMCNSGAGSPERRQLILEIAARQKVPA